MFFNRLTALVCGVFICMAAISQGKDIDYKFGNVTAKDFDISKDTVVDKDAAAVILYESGSTHFVGNNKGWFSFVYTCTRRIKIINERAFDLATVKIGLYTKANDAEVLSDVKAITYNVDNGIVSSLNMDKNSIFSEQEDDNHILKKFALPQVQQGSVIEYSYTITSPYDFNMPTWQFQTAEYPVLWSEYQVSIPATLTYVLIKQGIDSFYIKKSWEGKQNYKISRTSINNSFQNKNDLIVAANTLNYRWVEKDLQPLKIESYVSTPNNFVDQIEFQLSGTYNGEDKSEIINTWKAASEFFMEKNDFKQAVSNDNSWIKDLPDTKNGTSDLQTAKNIYYYIQKNYTCIDTNNVFIYTDLYEVYKKQKGTVRGINLLLISMLKNKGIYAEPVILSTRENGFINPNYPVFDKFNYIICRTITGGKVYLLDATDPVLGFGQLPNKCYNGYARVINENRPDSLYLYTDSLMESQISILSLNNDDNGKVSGTYKCVMGQSQSVDMRKKMRTTNADEYFKNVKKSFSFDVNVTNTEIDSLEQKELPVAIQYDIDFKMDDDIIYFNPLITDNVEKENPFKAAERSFPVEMPYCLDKTYVLNMQVPAGYKVDELPKSARVTLNDNEGMFEYLIQNKENAIQLRCRTKLNKANFEPDDYENLRNFFAFVVQKENEQIVFKKD